MRVVGYVRDAPGPTETEPAFAQSERIRKWVHETGHQMVALCQDVRTPGHTLGRDGFRALLGIVSSGEADAVVVPDLTVLSPDKVTQEIMLWDLRSRGVQVLSTDVADQPVLSDPPAEQIRLIVRDVLAKVAMHAEATSHLTQPGATVGLEPAGERGEDEDASDVIIELISPERSDPHDERISPAQ